MNLSNLRRPRGSRKAPRRAGRGENSGLGKTAGRGHKGQNARSGKKINPDFEGGQMPLLRRIPKSGFTNIHRETRAVINLSDLARFDAGSVVDVKTLKEKGLLKKGYEGRVKLLGQGALDRGLTVRLHAFSKGAQTAIEKAGGKTEVVK